MVYNIHIQTNRIVPSYEIRVRNPLPNNVEKKEPYDELSKRFNRYRHKIQYKENLYNSNDYVLCLDNPNAWFYRKFFYFYKPQKQIKSVDIFFQLSDKSRTYPLIFGFNEEGNSYYYTYYFLRGEGSSTSTISNRGLIDKDDLLTRLIEEYGLHETTRYNKFVIRLDKKPPTYRTDITYPKTGKNANKITLTKKAISPYPGYDLYEHKIALTSNVEDFFISVHDDTLFMFGSYGKLLKVEVCYEKKEDTMVVIIFTFKGRKKLYTRSEFISNLGLKDKALSKLQDFRDENITTILSQEFDKFKREKELNNKHREQSQPLKQNDTKNRDTPRPVTATTPQQKRVDTHNASVPSSGPGSLTPGMPGAPGVVTNRSVSPGASTGPVPGAVAPGDHVTPNTVNPGASNGGASGSPSPSVEPPVTVTSTSPTGEVRTSVGNLGGSGPEFKLVSGGPRPSGAVTRVTTSTGVAQPTAPLAGPGVAPAGPKSQPTAPTEDLRPLDDPEPPMKPVVQDGSSNRTYGSDTDHGSASPQAPGEKQFYDTDESSPAGKIGGGIAVGALGAGAIGGGSYYASGFIGLVQWLI